tara:strand:- start:327 stop:452 length:126 start_codon:yes stop_codon:yes gene_type:complete
MLLDPPLLDEDILIPYETKVMACTKKAAGIGANSVSTIGAV